jgi:hypothetical protein
MALDTERARTPPPGSNGRMADSLDEAKAVVRVTWERPLSSEKADRICSI